jgi:gas vesicle protein
MISPDNNGQRSSLNSKVQEFGLNVNSKAIQKRTGLASFVEQRPLVAGGVALTAGLVFSLAFPANRHEKNLMGKQSQALLSGAKEKALDLSEQIKTSSQNAIETLKDNTQNLPSFVYNAKESLREGIQDLAARTQVAVNEATQTVPLNESSKS